MEKGFSKQSLRLTLMRGQKWKRKLGLQTVQNTEEVGIRLNEEKMERIGSGRVEVYLL